MFYIILMVLIAIFAGILAHAPDEQFRDFLLAPPVWEDGEVGSLFRH